MPAAVPAALLLSATLCAVLYLLRSTQAETLPRSVLKTAAVALLALFVLLAHGPWAVAVALGICALGDWFLSRPGDQPFLIGIGAFATGHLAYVALILSQNQSHPAQLIALPHLWGLIGLAALGAVMALALAPRAGDLKPAVLIYIPIILAMGVAALTLPHGHMARPAALLFIASDTILAVEKFMLPATMPQDHPARRLSAYAIWVTYWLAQLGFAWAFLPMALAG